MRNACKYMRLVLRRAFCRMCRVSISLLRGMDDSLLADFHAVFSVSGDVNAPTRPHPTYSSLYKQKRQGYGEQEARRRRMLEEQRSRRKNYSDYLRKIAAGEEWEEEMEENEDGERDEVDFDHKRVSLTFNSHSVAIICYYCIYYRR